MIKQKNSYGEIALSDKYLSNLLGHVVSNSFGVVGMNVTNMEQGFRRLLGGSFGNQGVSVKQNGNALFIDLHVILSYGVNIKETVKNIIEGVSFAVEQQTGMAAARVSVHVDQIEG